MNDKVCNFFPAFFFLELVFFFIVLFVGCVQRCNNDPSSTERAKPAAIIQNEYMRMISSNDVKYFNQLRYRLTLSSSSFFFSSAFSSALFFVNSSRSLSKRCFVVSSSSQCHCPASLICLELVLFDRTVLGVLLNPLREKHAMINYIGVGK